MEQRGVEGGKEKGRGKDEGRGRGRKKGRRWGNIPEPLLCQYVTFAFMHHRYLLACHPYIFLHFQCFLFPCFYTVLVLISVTGRPKSKKGIVSSV